MDAQQRGGAGSDRLLVVRRARAVGRSHLDHSRSGQAHHVGHPEGTSDLDELAAGDDDLLAFAQRGERQQNGGRVVVDDQSRLATEQRGQQARDQPGTLASFPGLEVELEVAVAGGECERLHRGLR